MPKLTASYPKYRLHRASGQAIVTLNGKDHYLGLWRSRASKAEYDRLIAEWMANGRSLSALDGSDLTVVELGSAYWEFARGYYVMDGVSSGHLASIRVALRWLRRFYGRTEARKFGPLALRVLQQQFVSADHSRTYANRLCDIIRRAFKWAASQEMLPVTVYQALATVPGLRRGRTAARETVPVRPVSSETVESTLPHLPAVVAHMVRLQRLTGARPAEVCILRPCDLDAAGEVWSYRPQSHKTAHHGHERIIFIGPRGQEVLRPYLLREKTAYCFSPLESERKRNAEKRESRQTPMTPSQARRRPKKNRKRPPRDRYTPGSYRRAIHRACEAAFPPPEGLNAAALKEWRKKFQWNPNRLRHATATEVRSKFGLEAAQLALGHKRADVTQVYAERDLAKAAAVMSEIG